MAKLSLANKEEGINGECPNCGTHVTCRMSNYKGKFENKLQWQNDNGKAHIKFSPPNSYNCQIPDDVKSDIPPGTPATPNIPEPPESVPLPRAPPKNNYVQELSGNFIQNIIKTTNNIRQIEAIVRNEMARNQTTGKYDVPVNDAKVGMYVKFLVDIYDVNEREF